MKLEPFSGSASSIPDGASFVGRITYRGHPSGCCVVRSGGVLRLITTDSGGEAYSTVLEMSQIDSVAGLLIR